MQAESTGVPAGESAFSVPNMVNITCKSTSVQVALTNLLVAMETSNCSKPISYVGLEGAGVEAH